MQDISGQNSSVFVWLTYILTNVSMVFISVGVINFFVEVNFPKNINQTRTLVCILGIYKKDTYDWPLFVRKVLN